MKGPLILVAAVLLAACSGGGSTAVNAHPDGSEAQATGPTPLAPIDPATLPVVQAVLGIAPQAAPPTNRHAPAKVVVHIEVKEETREIADGVRYTFWTFGGSVPGPMIRVRRGDYVELHLQNHPNNTMPHNIDLHSVTGPGGGATSTFTAPGHQTQFSFRALNEGVYIYHCATAPVGMHIANGMYGLIVVEPEDGYEPVDKEYYVVQGDFYTPGDYRALGDQPFDMNRAIHEDPSYVVFNGRDGALVGERALTAQTGQRVRMFVGNGGPNLVSSFHVIGEIFDHVYSEGSSEAITNVQTTLVPAGGSAIVDFRLEVPGTYILVDHSIFRAFNKGALGMLRVTGGEDRIVYSGREVDETYLGAAGPSAAAASAGVAGDSPEARQRRGETTFLGVCATCHQRDARGLATLFPPLAQSDFVNGDKNRVIRAVLAGLSGPIQVNGTTFNGAMPALANLTDHEVADVLTYVRSHFGNQSAPVTDAEVAAVRAELAHAAPPAAGHP